MNRNTIITGVVALIVGLLIGWMIGHGAATSKTAMNGDNMKADTNSAMTDDENTSMDDDSSMMDNDNAMMSDGSAVMVTDQSAGNTVTVASVETDQTTWVAVRDNVKGGLGKILGAARVESGASNNVVVPLLRPTMAGNNYFVVLFKDNGDRVFDSKTDMMIESDGTPMTQAFKTLAQ